MLERLQLLSKPLPAGTVPTLEPDATGVGHVFWYTVEGGSKSLQELRTIQDWFIRYQLNAVPGVTEVASVGGVVRQYQIDVDPNRLRAYRIPISAVVDAVMRSNRNVGDNVVMPPLRVRTRLAIPGNVIVVSGTTACGPAGQRSSVAAFHVRGACLSAAEYRANPGTEAARRFQIAARLGPVSWTPGSTEWHAAHCTKSAAPRAGSPAGACAAAGTRIRSMAVASSGTATAR